jgi:iron-regulated transporter 1
MLFASAVGNWIDRAPARLPALLITIVLNHAAIIASYLCWLYWPVITGNTDESTGSQAAGPFSNFSRGFMYGLILFLDVVHDLSAIANRLSVERDWIPTLVGPITPDLSYDLTQINSVFVRIEHIVKLVAPSLLPLIMSTITIRAKWILLLIGMTVLLWVIEVWFARAIAAENPELQAAKKPSHNMEAMEDTPVSERFSHLKLGVQSWPQKLCVVLYRDPAARLKHFFSIRMWPASMSVSLLQLTVLAYSATLITYLLEVGFSLSLITIGKASGSITALASTIITPAAVRYMRKRQARRQRIGESEDDDLDGGEGRIVRTVGLWGIASQFLFLVSLPPLTQFPTLPIFFSKALFH